MMMRGVEDEGFLTSQVCLPSQESCCSTWHGRVTYAGVAICLFVFSYYSRLHISFSMAIVSRVHSFHFIIYLLHKLVCSFSIFCFYFFLFLSLGLLPDPHFYAHFAYHANLPFSVYRTI